ncbi:MAG: RNA-guided endonuclease InsQ/TnpB family protein [Candidatus Izemoplasmataceae bacterium]
MGKVTRGYVYRIRPNTSQKILINKTFGCNRLMWNELLNDIKNKAYRTPKEIKTQYDFMYECDSQSFTTTWKHLNQAIKHKKNKTHQFPKFKSKHDHIQSYTTHVVNNNIRLEGKYIRLPKLGKMRLVQHRELPSESTIKAVTIKRDAGHYYVILRIVYEQTKEKASDVRQVIGLDYSLSHLYVDHNGNNPNYPKYYHKMMDHLAKAQRILSKKVKGSNHYQKQKQKVQKIHKKISNQRKDFLHKVSRELVNKYDLICIEDLDLKEMTKTKHFSKSIFDTSYHMFTLFLDYKTKDEGKSLIKINRYYPSTKTCSKCGNIQDIPLSQRTYICDCGHKMDRDQNAAINIATRGLISNLQTEYGTDSIAW